MSEIYNTYTGITSGRPRTSSPRKITPKKKIVYSRITSCLLRAPFHNERTREKYKKKIYIYIPEWLADFRAALRHERTRETPPWRSILFLFTKKIQVACHAQFLGFSILLWLLWLFNSIIIIISLCTSNVSLAYFTIIIILRTIIIILLTFIIILLTSNVSLACNGMSSTKHGR